VSTLWVSQVEHSARGRNPAPISAFKLRLLAIRHLSMCEREQG
jgi:hypothetical protein